MDMLFQEVTNIGEFSRRTEPQHVQKRAAFLFSHLKFGEGLFFLLITVIVTAHLFLKREQIEEVEWEGKMKMNSVRVSE